MKKHRVKMDWSKLDAILQYNAQLKDASEILGCSEDTIERRIREKYDCTYAEYRDKKLGKVRIKLVQKAIDMAMMGNTAMMIFCLKNLCGWADKTEVATPDGKIFTLNYNIENKKFKKN